MKTIYIFLLLYHRETEIWAFRFFCQKPCLLLPARTSKVAPSPLSFQQKKTPFLINTDLLLKQVLYPSSEWIDLEKKGSVRRTKVHRLRARSSSGWRASALPEDSAGFYHEKGVFSLFLSVFIFVCVKASV